MMLVSIRANSHQNTNMCTNITVLLTVTLFSNGGIPREYCKPDNYHLTTLKLSVDVNRGLIFPFR